MAADAAGVPVPSLEIRFDLLGRTAGQARSVPGRPWLIRYNLLLLCENTRDFLETTVPHEVAHVIAFLSKGPRIRPHGPEWRAVMRNLGAEPRRCHDYDITRIPGRRLKEFHYHCGCRNHVLSSIRHNRVLAGRTYLCRRCACPLRPGQHPGAPAA